MAEGKRSSGGAPPAVAGRPSSAPRSRPLTPPPIPPPARRITTPYPCPQPQLVPIKQRECLEYVGQVEEAMVKGLSFEVPKEYADRPLLLVRGGVVF